MTEREKRDLGLWYDANYDAELLEEREKAEELCFALNHTAPREHEKQDRIIGELLAGSKIPSQAPPATSMASRI